jgi:hypothetical protein
MPIPTTRKELVDQIVDAFGKLDAELQGVDGALAAQICVDDWSIKDLLAVRLWWTSSVLDWVDQGRQGAIPVTPAANYRWSETPRLNADVVSASRERDFASIVADLRCQYQRLLTTIDTLDDHELLSVGAFDWAGRYPIARWLSINTTRQYRTARTYIRRVKRRVASAAARRP